MYFPIGLYIFFPEKLITICPCVKTNLKDTKGLEREPLRYWEGEGKVTFTRPSLILDKVTFDEQVNVLERYCKVLLYWDI